MPSGSPGAAVCNPNARVAKDDLENLGFFEWLASNSVSRSFSLTMHQMQADELRAKMILQKGWLSQEDHDALRDHDMAQKIEGDPVGNAPWWSGRGLISGLGHLTANVGYGTWRAKREIGVGGAAGAVIGGIGGAFVGRLGLLYVMPAVVSAVLGHAMGKAPLDDDWGDWLADIAAESVATAMNTMVSPRSRRRPSRG